MTEKQPFVRKLIYLGVMVALMIPMHLLGQPASRSGAGTGELSGGGVLAKQRENLGLSQANLGEIDPASETMKFATLGMRGIAVNILWGKADEYRQRKDWTNLRATLDQIANLQPNFVSVWVFQGWNLSYNVSAEWDDYRDRYHWVKEGIMFYDRGTQYNQRDQKLLGEIGRTTSQKIGRSDEAKPFRRLFRKDLDFHRAMRFQNSERDCWMAGREYYKHAEEVVEKYGLEIKGGSPVTFYCWAPMCRINYAEGLEEDGGPDGRGVFGEVAQRAWSDALKEYVAYGQRELSNTIGDVVRLDEAKGDELRLIALEKEAFALDPELKQKMLDEMRAKMSDEDRELFDGPPPTQLGPKLAKYDGLHRAYRVTLEGFTQRLEDPEKKARAKEILEESFKVYARWKACERQIGIVNYDHWKLRCTYEKEPETVEARRLMSVAEQADKVDANLVAAKESYAASFAEWDKILSRFPEARRSDYITEEVFPSIDRYRVILTELGEKFPEDFPLADILDKAMKDPKFRN